MKSKLDHIQIKAQIQKALKNGLPGPVAQAKMMNPIFRKPSMEHYFNPPENAKKASVLILLYPKETQWHFALMQRPYSPYAHSRQISLPGGQKEYNDINDAATALRETEEEFGIDKNKIELIGQLSQLYIPVSRFLVQPFIGTMNETPVFNPDKKEVEAIIEVPINRLLDPRTVDKKDISTANDYVLKDTPYFNLNSKVVWGATAMILSEFKELLVLNLYPYHF